MDRETDPLGIEDLKFDAAGLIPAVIQQYDTLEILMVAYMNKESVAKTLETGKTWFWSRSRQKYWMKGESSGHTQEVKDLLYDCDADCLLVYVDQTGVACHTGNRTCFYRSLVHPNEDVSASGISSDVGEVIDELFAVLQQRKRDMPEGSYTTKLLTDHEDQLLKKIGEEATEVVMAAKDADNDQLRYEIADLLYHVLVVMVRSGLTPDDIARELADRRS